MSRFVLSLAFAAVAAVFAAGLFGPAAIHEGQEIQLRDGRRWVVLARAPHVAGAWLVQIGRLPRGEPVCWVPAVLTIDADDLADAIAGDYPATPKSAEYE